MDYENFKADLTSALEDLGYSRDKLMFSENQKNNGVTVRALTVKNTDSPIAPCINLEKLIEDHATGASMDEIAAFIDNIIKQQPDFSQTDFSLTWDRVKDNVVFVLVNGENNKELLDNAPHISFRDFAMIYKIDTNFIGIPGMITVKDDLMKMLGVDSKTLLDAALENTPRLMPVYTGKLQDVMAEMMGIPMDAEIPADMDMPDIIISSNTDKCYGASAMLYAGFQDKLGEMGIEDCYVLPSSVHECLMVADNFERGREDLEDMVRSVNASDCVSDMEFLSNKVYRYSEIRKGFNDAIAMEMGNYKAESKGVRGEIEEIKAEMAANDMAELSPDKTMKK